jgi:hypothetical protein
MGEGSILIWWTHFQELVAVTGKYSGKLFHTSPKQYDPTPYTTEENTDLLPKICGIKHNIENNNSRLLSNSLVKQ